MPEVNYFMVGLFYGGVGGAIVGALFMGVIPRLLDGYWNSYQKKREKKDNDSE